MISAKWLDVFNGTVSGSYWSVLRFVISLHCRGKNLDVGVSLPRPCSDLSGVCESPSKNECFVRFVLIYFLPKWVHLRLGMPPGLACVSIEVNERRLWLILTMTNIFPILYDQWGSQPGRLTPFAQGLRPTEVGSISANVLRFAGATLVHFSILTDAGTPWASNLVSDWSLILRWTNGFGWCCRN